MGTDVLTTDMTKLARVKNYIGGSVQSGAEDSHLQQLIYSASAWCSRFCRRDSFLQTTYTHDGFVAGREFLDGHGDELLFLRNTPVTSITSLKRRFGETALVQGADQHFTLDPWTGRIRLRAMVFPDEPQAVEIVYVGGYIRDDDGTANERAQFGYLERAQDLEHSIVRMCATLYHRRKRERDGIISMSTDGGTFQFDDSAIPKDIRNVWDSYRHTEIG